jgi:hypothetical protein
MLFLQCKNEVPHYFFRKKSAFFLRIYEVLDFFRRNTEVLDLFTAEITLLAGLLK